MVQKHWKTMNLMMAIMPTTLLGVLPIGLLLTQSGVSRLLNWRWELFFR